MTMKRYTDMTKEELGLELASVRAEYKELAAMPRKLDMSRGKPNPVQLDLSMGLRGQHPAGLIVTRKGTDVRNYGELAGVDECKQLFADLLGLEQKNIIMGGQSSLNLMYDAAAGGVQRLPALGQTGTGQIPVPGTGLRPPLRHMPGVRH